MDALRAQLQNEAIQIRVLRDGAALPGDALVGTGCVVQCVSTDDPSVVYDNATVLLLGDVDGDGRVLENDATAIRAAIFDASAIAAGVYTLAADLNGDGVIDGFDMLYVQQRMEATR